MRCFRQACGENLRHYGNRMDSAWALRSAYEQARKIKTTQDDYCLKAEAGLWHELRDPFPESLQWEMLVDVLRGKVKVKLDYSLESVDRSLKVCRLRIIVTRPLTLILLFE